MISGFKLKLSTSMILGNGFRDSKGRPHVPHGVFTFKAKFYAHVCFDRHPGIGRRCWHGPLEDLQVQIITRRIEPVYGSFPGSSVKTTGSGFCVDPRDAGMESFNIDEFCVDGLQENANGAVLIVKNWLQKRYKREYREATTDEQLSGIDIVSVTDPDRTFEVKARFGEWDKIFVQLGETNPDGKH